MCKVKCVECGFLAIRHQHGVLESTETTREKGTYNYYTSRIHSGNAKFLCYKKRQEFCIKDHSSDPQENAEMLHAEIDCEAFCEWYPGKTPKEHEEMSLVEIVRAESKIARAEDLERQLKWRKEDLEWRQDVESGVNKRFSESEGREKTHFWQGAVTQVLIGLILMLAATIFGFLIGRGSP